MFFNASRCLLLLNFTKFVREKKLKEGKWRKSSLFENIHLCFLGEYGADRIYAGQLAVLGNTDVGPTIKHMWDQVFTYAKLPLLLAIRESLVF